MTGPHENGEPTPPDDAGRPGWLGWLSPRRTGAAFVVLVAVVAVITVVSAGGQPPEEVAARPTVTADGSGGAPPSLAPRTSGSTDRPTHDTSTETPAQPTPTRSPAPRLQRTFLVVRVVDGDTLELGNGETVRLVGIDTPERGRCGYDAATERLRAMVGGERVRLGASDEDRDAYGRLLRYVDLGSLDAGLRLIEAGLAIARYDSRDGYGRHPREDRYVAADRRSPDPHCSAPRPEERTDHPGTPAQGCGYAPCLPAYPPDLDCADVDGPVRVTGEDPHGLDRDGDGIACE